MGGHRNGKSLFSEYEVPVAQDEEVLDCCYATYAVPIVSNNAARQVCNPNLWQEGTGHRSFPPPFCLWGCREAQSPCEHAAALCSPEGSCPNMAGRSPGPGESELLAVGQTRPQLSFFFLEIGQ